MTVQAVLNRITPPIFLPREQGTWIDTKRDQEPPYSNSDSNSPYLQLAKSLGKTAVYGIIVLQNCESLESAVRSMRAEGINRNNLFTCFVELQKWNGSINLLFPEMTALFRKARVVYKINSEKEPPRSKL